MTELDPDLPPTEGTAFEAAYNIPSNLPEDLKGLHTEVVNRMRNEARGVSMSQVQEMLIERIAYFYVAMKWRELDANVPMSLKENKEMLDFWWKMVDGFNRMLAASETKNRTTLLVEIQNILRNSLKKVTDPLLKQELARDWDAEFDRINI